MATVVISFWLCTYYNVIISWAMVYLISSVQDPLPWAGCGNAWNTKLCWDINARNNVTSPEAQSSSQEFYE